MKLFITSLSITLLSLVFTTVQAQEKPLDSLKTPFKELEMKKLIESKKTVEIREKAFLKEDILAINARLKKGEITEAEAINLKTKAAQKRALNIDNHLAIIDNEIALLKRSDKLHQLDIRDEENRLIFRIGSGSSTGDDVIFIGKESSDKPKKYDKRTLKDLVFSFGFNNAIIEGQSLENSPYKIGGSGFLELGHDWKTRIFNTSNFWRFKFGFSFQWNKFEIKNNNYLVNSNGSTSLEEFPSQLDKAKFRTTNLVFPFHIEFGPSKKIEKKDYFRYDTRKNLKIGLGAYAGVNLGNMQKLKYRIDGDRLKDKQKGVFEVNNFVYGLSSYVGIGSTALYVKYDLSPVFKNQSKKQNNISLGLRLDID